jgi:uncharacterized protein YjbJ (UPF0337 family)
MSVLDRVKHQAQELAGKAKEAVGRAGGKRDLKKAGKRDRLEGELKKKGKDIKDKAARAVEDTKGRFRKESR